MANASQLVAKDDPLMIAWEAHKTTPEFRNALHWAMKISPEVQAGDSDGKNIRDYTIMPREQREQNIIGSLWECYRLGYEAARKRMAEVCRELADTSSSRMLANGMEDAASAIERDGKEKP